MRRSLTVLGKLRDPLPAKELPLRLELVRPAQRHWLVYYRQLLEGKKSRRHVDYDWLIDRATEATAAEDAFLPLTFLRVVQECPKGPSKAHGRALLDVATRDDGWSAPLRVLAAAGWGRSQDWKPDAVVDGLLQFNDYPTRRAFAATLGRGARKRAVLMEKTVSLDPELEPVARWFCAN